MFHFIASFCAPEAGASTGVVVCIACRCNLLLHARKVLEGGWRNMRGHQDELAARLRCQSPTPNFFR
jgi:hypothetical protein